jgi:hypothetical protein
MVSKSVGWKLLLMVILLMQTPAAYSQSTDQPQEPHQDPVWKDGAFIDSAYLLDFNHPANDLFRSRSTAYKFDDPIVNMAAAYLRKNSSEVSRWGIELTVQAGQDTRLFGFSPTAPNLPGSKWLRHLGATDASYQLPAGKGLTVQGGIFGSLIGYDSLYAKDNFNYTRPWMADFTPYLMMGVNASYPFSDRLTATAFVINGYFHLADANSVPSWGGQLAYKPDDHWTLKETVLIGPAQSNTAFAFWRFFSDTIVERKRDPLTIAFEYQSGTEQVAATGRPRSAWVASQLPAHWTISKRWSVTVRPEVAWDNDGRWTGFAQTVKAVTTTGEYRFPIRAVTGILRLEHRFDDSRGPGGGFFRGSETAGGIVPLTPSQHLLIFAAIFTFDGQIPSK